MFNEFLQGLVEYLHCNIAAVFKEIQITVEEYSFLKTILLFSGGMRLLFRNSRFVFAFINTY